MKEIMPIYKCLQGRVEEFFRIVLQGYEQVGKAGTRRLMGIRPSVRGKAMNPCDHPHGGGEGNTPIGMPHPKTPWGKLARGGKTRRKSWTDKMIISRRVKK